MTDKKTPKPKPKPKPTPTKKDGFSKNEKAVNVPIPPPIKKT